MRQTDSGGKGIGGMIKKENPPPLSFPVKNGSFRTAQPQAEECCRMKIRERIEYPV